MFNVDIGSQGSGGSEGPFIAWTARESMDGDIPGRSFVIRDADGRKLFDGFNKGVVLDIYNMKTGWCYSTGQKGTAPEWKWNATTAHFEEMPPARPGEYRWTKGFHIPLAYGKENKAIWEQAQAGAYQGFCQLVAILVAANPDGARLPVVKMKSSIKIESARGTTHAPEFEILKWVDRPEILGTAKPAPKKAMADDEVPF